MDFSKHESCQIYAERFGLFFLKIIAIGLDSNLAQISVFCSCKKLASKIANVLKIVNLVIIQCFIRNKSDHVFASLDSRSVEDLP